MSTCKGAAVSIPSYYISGAVIYRAAVPSPTTFKVLSVTAVPSPGTFKV